MIKIDYQCYIQRNGQFLVDYGNDKRDKNKHNCIIVIVPHNFCTIEELMAMKLTDFKKFQKVLDKYDRYTHTFLYFKNYDK